MEFDIIRFILLTLPLVLLTIFMCNKKSKYYAKMVVYSISLILLSWILIPYFLLRPGNLNNSIMYANIGKYLTVLLGIKWILRGEEHLRQNESYIIVANHQSSLDVLGMLTIWNSMKRLTGIAKKELLYLFPGMYFAGTIFMNRKNAKGLEVLNKAVERVKNEKVKLWIFPEGTRRNTGEIHSFKKGAFYSAIHHQVPIIPIVFSSYRHFLNDEKKIFDGGEMIIQALPEISTTGLTVKDVDELMEHTRQKMIETYEKISFEVTKKN